MKKGLNLLSQRSRTQELVDLSDTNKFPPHFKKFVTLYSLGYGMLNLQKLKTNEEEFESFTIVKMFNNYIINSEEYNATIDLVFDIPELKEEYENYLNKVDHWHDEGLMKIGLMFHGDVLLLGMKDSRVDEIWRYGNGLLNNVCCKLDDDIFTFFSRLEEEIDAEKQKELRFSENQLYKNWSEDFWKIKNKIE